MSTQVATPPSHEAPAPQALALAPSAPHAPRDRLGALALLALPTLLVAGVLCLIAFFAGGEPNPSGWTSVDIVLTLASGGGVAVLVVLTPAGRPAHGLWPAGLLLAFAAFAALSVVWSVQPDASWQDAGRLLAYSGVFGMAVVLARAMPARWSEVLGGVVLAAVVVCGYALLTKIFPNRLGAEQIYARLSEPYGYWNATGLTAALGVIGCMWLGARRAGHGLLSALAYPAMGIMWVTLLLAYSRGALAALGLGLLLWFCIVPLRLRGAAVLLTGGLAGALVVAWDFSRHALTTDHTALATRIPAGHQLGVLVAAMLVLLTLAGLAIGFLSGRRAPASRTRRRAGALLLSLPVVAVLAFAGLLAASHRGLFGSISHGVSALTNPNASTPSGPSRLTAVGSVRARYWKEALQIFEGRPLLGAGAEGYATARLRYRTAPINVQHAHGFLVQTLADLGLIGLILVLALLATWLVAAGRATTPFNRRWSAWPRRAGEDPAGGGGSTLCTPERIALLTMLCLVVTFGIHSFVDWTWYVPGDACVALLCAGWLAGRGPLRSDLGAIEVPAGSRAAAALAPSAHGELGPEGRLRLPSFGELDPLRTDLRSLGIALAVVIATLLAAWAEWQPQRSADAANQALTLAKREPARALAAAHTAVDRDPLSAEALLTLAAIQQGAGLAGAAQASYERAVHLQPSNPQTWQALGEYELSAGQPKNALDALRAAVYLNPQAIDSRATIGEDGELLTLQDAYLQALRANASSGGTAAGGTVGGSTAPLKSARAAQLPAARDAPRVGLPRHVSRSARSRSPRAG
jgi:O-antigen ligase